MRALREILKDMYGNALAVGEQGTCGDDPDKDAYHLKLVAEADAVIAETVRVAINGKIDEVERELRVINLQNHVRLEQAAHTLRDVLPGYGVSQHELQGITRPLQKVLMRFLETPE